MLSPDQAKEAYQSAIPERREKFAYAVRQCLKDASHNNAIQQYYTTELMRLAKAELRGRLEMAARRIKQLIDSGWTPTQMLTVSTVFGKMFAQYNHWNRNSFDDLTSAVDGAFEAIGLPSNTRTHQLYCLEFSQYQVDVSNEFTHDLEFYMAAKQPENGPTTVHVEGNVNFLQTGGTSNVTQYIGSDLSHVVEALRHLKSTVTESGEQHAGAIDDVIDRAIETAKKDGATWPMLGRALDGVQNLIRTTGAVPSAWNLIVAIAATHGVALPHLPTTP